MEKPLMLEALPSLLSKSWYQHENYVLYCLCVLFASVCLNPEPLKYFGLFMIFKDILKMTAAPSEVSVGLEHAPNPVCARTDAGSSLPCSHTAFMSISQKQNPQCPWAHERCCRDRDGKGEKKESSNLEEG